MPSEVVILGSGIFYSVQTCRSIESEFRIKCRRLEGIDQMASAGIDAGGVQLVIIDQCHGGDMLARGDAYREAVGSASVALAYRDAAVAKDFRFSAQQAWGRPIGFLPMNVSVEVWLSMLRLLLHQQIFVPEELLLSSSAVKPVCGTSALPRNGRHPDGSAGRLSALTGREREVLDLVVQGESNKCIAAKLAITEHTVKLHVHNMVRKMGVTNRTAATSLYFEEVRGGQQT